MELELSPPLKYVAALPRETLSGQLNYTSLHSIVRIIFSCQSGGFCFMSFYLFIYFSSRSRRNYNIIAIFCLLH